MSETKELDIGDFYSNHDKGYRIARTNSGYELFEFNTGSGLWDYYRTYHTFREAEVIAINIFI